MMMMMVVRMMIIEMLYIICISHISGGALPKIKSDIC